jgi:hypothetical protein
MWTEKLFFHLFDLDTLNSCILLSSCGGKKISNGDFQLALLRNMLAMVGQQQWLEGPAKRSTTGSANIRKLGTSFKKHWPGPNTPGRLHVCSARGVTWQVHVTCLKCDVVLCVDEMCFAVITNTSSCATPIHKFEAWNQNVSKKSEFLQISRHLFCVLGNKATYSIFMDMLCNFCSISHKLLFHAEIYYFSFKKYWLFL